MKRIFYLPLLMFIFVAFAWAEMNQAPPPQVVTDPRQAFMTGSIVVKGEGSAPSDRSLNAAQKRIMALRAAKVVALREVAEIIDGVAVNGDTTIVNASVESDIVRAAVQGIVKGAQVISETYDQMSDMAVVYISVPMRGPNGLVGQLVPLMPVAAAPLYMPPAGAPQAAQFDGLIVDVRDQPFKPALINRVVTKTGEVVYDPAKVAQDILVQRGAAEYTNDPGKARALLAERGVVNPLTVKAGGIVKATDAVVTPEDAASISASNQTHSYLEGAKVVFVLK